jgi:holo-[acyl-carrier protein] synthase
VEAGTDVVEHERFLASISRGDGRLRKRLFTREELEEHPLPLDLATIFSAKESIVKALGTGFSDDLSWHDISISLSDDQLKARLSGRVLELVGDRKLMLSASRGEHRTVTCALLSERS